MSKRKKSKATRSTTSLPESVGDQLPSESQSGQMKDLFGQVVAHASHSAQQETKKANMMNVTFGLLGLGSSESQSLQRSLVSKLQEQLPMAGGIMWPLTWKKKVTPAGRQHYQLAVSEHPTAGTDYGLWPTCSATDARRAGTITEKMSGTSLPQKVNEVAMGLWPTPRVTGAEQIETKKKRSTTGMSLEGAAMWATPNTMDHLDQRSYEAMKKMATNGGRKNRSFPSNLREQVDPVMCQAYKDAQVEANLWPTPRAREDNGYQKKGNDWWITLAGAVGAAKTPASSGSCARTGKRGQLNVEFVCWLMGYNTEHLQSMRLAMQSYRRLRRNSSKQRKR